MYILGIDPTSVRALADGPEFKLGTLGATGPTATGYTAPMPDTGTSAGNYIPPKVFMYVQFAAGGATGLGYSVIVNPSTFVATLLTTALAAPGTGQGWPVGVSQNVVGASGYGWVQVYGQSLVVAANGTAVGTRLATGSGGILVTGVGATTAYLVNGVTLTAAGVTNTPVAAWVNYPVTSIFGAAN